MLKLFLGTVLLVLLAGGTAIAFLPNGFQVYFTNPQQSCGDPTALDSRFMNFLQSAQDSVDAVFYEIRWANYDCHPNPMETFCAINESVQVRIISDNQFASSNDDYDTLSAYGVGLAYDNMGLCPWDSSYSMHNKFCIVDGQRLWTGSTNMTYSGCWWNNNNSMVIDCAQLGQAYEAEFGEMWDTPPNHNASRFHRCKLGTTPTPDTADCDGVPVEYFFTPPSCLEDRVIEAIDDAQENVYFCMFTITSTGIRNALINAWSRGIWVEGVIDSICLESGSCQYNSLVAAGVPVCWVARDWGYVHHKFMLVDHNTTHDPKLFTGSNNWSYSADNYNDENMIVVHDQNVAAEYYNEYRGIRHLCAPITGGVSGTVTLDDNVYIGIDTTAIITIADNDTLVNRDPGVVDTTVVTVQTQNTDTVGELIPLVETGANTGQFTGTVGFESSVAKGNGKVGVVNGEQVTVTYDDAASALGLGVLVTDQAHWYVSADSFPRVYVNELYVDALSAGEGAEFVELYNPSTRSIDIGGWRLQDQPSYSLSIWEFPTETWVPAEGYLVVARDGSDPVNDGFLEELGFHADFEYYDVPNETTKTDDSLTVNMIQVTFTTGDNQIRLGNTSDGVYLFTGNTFTTGIVVDSLSYTSGPGTGKSWGRCPDGSGSARILDTPNPGNPNCLLPIADLTAHLADSSIVLIWSVPHGGSGADHYVVYRDTVPDLAAESGDSLAETSDTSYIDNTVGVVGDTLTHYFYAVRGVETGGYTSEASNIVGEFDKTLTTGVSK